MQGGGAICVKEAKTGKREKCNNFGCLENAKSKIICEKYTNDM